MVHTESPRPADGAADPSLGNLVAQAAADLSKLVQCEIDLAKLEFRADAKRLGVAGAMAGACAYIGTLVLVMLCFALAYGLITLGIWNWAAFLIVAGALVLVIAIAGSTAWLKVRRLNRLERTRKTLQDDLAIMNRGEPATAAPAIEAR